MFSQIRVAYNNLNVLVTAFFTPERVKISLFITSISTTAFLLVAVKHQDCSHTTIT